MLCPLSVAPSSSVEGPVETFESLRFLVSTRVSHCRRCRRCLLRPPASRSLAAPEEPRLGVSVRLRQKPTSDVETTARAAETPASAAPRLGFLRPSLWFLLSSAGFCPKTCLLVNFLRFGVVHRTCCGGGDAGLGQFLRPRDSRHARFLARASLGWCGVGRSATRF